MPLSPSQFEEKIEDIQGVEPPSCYPSTSGFDENPATSMVMEESRGEEVEMQEQDGHRMCSELNTAHDFVSGIMKIVPSDVDVSFLYLLSFFRNMQPNNCMFAWNVNNTCKHKQ